MIALIFGMACVTALIAGSRGRMWPIWFALGLFFGPFALIAAACMRDVNGDNSGEIQTIVVPVGTKIGDVTVQSNKRLIVGRYGYIAR